MVDQGQQDGASIFINPQYVAMISTAGNSQVFLSPNSEQKDFSATFCIDSRPLKSFLQPTDKMKEFWFLARLYEQTSATASMAATAWIGKQNASENKSLVCILQNNNTTQFIFYFFYESLMNKKN